MKIVALEIKNIGSDIDLSEFNELGEFVCYEKTSVEQINERASDADVLIMNKLPINESTIGELTNLKLICVTATGYDNIDIEYCRRRGIPVCNSKGYSTESVVQHTFAALFYIYEKLKYYDDYVKSGKYCENDCFTHFNNYFNELSGKTWGIVGLGDIGKGVARVAGAFGCNVIYYSTSGKNNSNEYDRVEFDEMLEQADIISIHAPLNDNTRNLFSTQAFNKMKSTAYIINMGRGPIVDEEALLEALNNKQIAGAALDVLSKEPMSKMNPLINYSDSDRLFITPHIAWATVEARKRLMHDVYLNIKGFKKDERRNIVNAN